MEGKKWYQSKLMWTGMTALLTSIALVVTGEATWPEALLGVEGFLVVVLRLFTSKPII